MSLLSKLEDAETWERFYAYKTALVSSGPFVTELRRFLDEKAYLPVLQTSFQKERFPLPEKKLIRKLYTEKSRVVYAYPAAESCVLKLLTYLMLRKYDGIFSARLFSFRPGRTAKDAVRMLLRTPGLDGLWCYKADVHNYFNSIPVGRLLPMLKETLSDDPGLYAFLSRLLTEPCVLDRGKEITEEKGIMAGTPLSAFYANLYLRDLDRRFEERGIPYARYSDDIILFAETEEKARACRDEIRAFLTERGLSINPDKECFSAPGEAFTFLGFSIAGRTIDIAEASVDKLKKKMRRKTRALKRWQERSGLEREKAAKAFIRIFKRKLLESPEGSELSWSLWFFPVINTAKSLRIIDRYAEDCIRFLMSGTRTKSRFNVRYGDLKALGFESLVHAYYSFEKNDNAE